LKFGNFKQRGVKRRSGEERSDEAVHLFDINVKIKSLDFTLNQNEGAVRVSPDLEPVFKNIFGHPTI